MVAIAARSWILIDWWCGGGVDGRGRVVSLWKKLARGRKVFTVKTKFSFSFFRQSSFEHFHVFFIVIDSELSRRQWKSSTSRLGQIWIPLLVQGRLLGPQMRLLQKWPRQRIHIVVFISKVTTIFTVGGRGGAYLSGETLLQSCTSDGSLMSEHSLKEVAIWHWT